MKSVTKTTPSQSEISFSRPTDDTLLVRLSGSWKMQDKLPSHTEVEQQVASGPRVKRVAFDTQGITAWDSVFVTFVLKILTQNTQNQIETDRAGLPEGVRRLLALATAVPEREGAAKKAVRIPRLVRVGKGTIAAVEEAKGMLAFLGEALLAFLTFLRGKARFRRSDLFLIIQESGANALGIVTLISFLVGLILAFMGGIQLRQFAAEIYVANLVGLGMIREMAPIMTGIIMAGRTGAAFAAQLGTMQVNEEIDALKVLGLSPMEFLVLPRMLALVLMMPLLTLYADLVSILGGLVVAQGFGISATEYLIQTMKAVHLHDLAVGLFKSAVFGVIVAVSGCLRGIQCGRSAQAVGEATTSAVVMAIVLIITLDGILAVVTDVIGI
ncbi:MAG: ABC transporter permease [candidate division NC10 bacterium]|nr:ABC transporter permease [candidate division NC10 bacterium]